MKKRKLFILIEGVDDKRFFEKIIKPRISSVYCSINIDTSAQTGNEKIRRYVKSFHKMGADYIFVTDLDEKACITKKKNDIHRKFRVRQDNIIIVVKEIEGWYFAGLSGKDINKLGIRGIINANTITKEEFNRIIPKQYESRLAFLLEILENYNIRAGKRNNESFCYFMNKYVSP